MRAAAVAALLAVLSLGGTVTACDAGSSDSHAGPGDSDTGTGPAPDGSTDEPDAGDGGPGGSVIHFDDAFARAAHERPLGGWIVLLERPVYLRERHGLPDRQVLVLDAQGEETARFGAAAGRELLDVVVHTSGELTALEASSDGYHLVRFDGSGERMRETLIADDAIYTDLPVMNDGEVRSRIETHTHDTGRILASSEGIVLVTRTGRHSVVTYGIAFDPAAGYAASWRTLVVPAHRISQVGLIGGSYDTFGQVDSQYAVHLARDEAGTIYVGVQHARVESGAMVKAIENVFGDELTTDPDHLDLFVTRLGRGGERLGISVVGTPEDDQLYGLRGDATGALVLGRSEIWNAQGTGFEALVGHVDAEGGVTIDRFDIDRSDLAFDATRTSSGDVVVVGARGYWQNPRGASVSEEAEPFALTRRDGTTLGTLALPDGPRHSEARFIVPARDGRLLIGGMLDGPGTHSADADRSLLRARGFLTFIEPR